MFKFSDFCGFVVKFRMVEGNWDFVVNNIFVFFCELCFFIQCNE